MWLRDWSSLSVDFMENFDLRCGLKQKSHRLTQILTSEFKNSQFRNGLKSEISDLDFITLTVNLNN